MLQGELDDEAAHAMAAEARTWRRDAAVRADAHAPDTLFLFTELCDTQATLNQSAATSPEDKIPMQAVCSSVEAARACMLGILNLAYLCRTLPWLWSLVTILPLLKRGKPRACIEGHIPISLLAALLKVFDKLLLNRIWPRVRAAVYPWQAGGALGADITA